MRWVIETAWIAGVNAVVVLAFRAGAEPVMALLPTTRVGGGVIGAQASLSAASIVVDALVQAQARAK